MVFAAISVFDVIINTANKSLHQVIIIIYNSFRLKVAFMQVHLDIIHIRHFILEKTQNATSDISLGYRMCRSVWKFYQSLCKRAFLIIQRRTEK